MRPDRGQGVYNVVVIGAGTAGLVTAAATAGLGGRVALVERHRMGGDCLNTGCVPSKALLSSARVAQVFREAARWGLAAQEPRFRFEDVMERVRGRRAALAPHDSQERFESLGVDVFRGPARFVSPHEVVVGEGEARLRGRFFVIAAGSRAALPPIEGLAGAAPFTNETVFDELTSRPERLIVLGGGPIGCELGQAFGRLGVRVTILERVSRLLEKEDAEAAEVVRARLVAEGVRVVTGTQARKVTRQGAITRVELSDGETLEAEALLVAAGRVPNTDGLGLEAAGVAFDSGGITVDAHLRTSQPHIYAAGDVAGSYQFTHLADHHARVVVRNILVPWPKAKVDLSVLPWCTYTSPEVARVGLIEAEAQPRGVPFEVWRQPLREVDRAVLESEEEGFVKVLTARGTDRILGVTVVAERAGDLLHEYVLAMRAGVGLGGLSALIHAYPTFAEAARKVGDAYRRTRLTPRARRLLSWWYRRQREGAR
jgi:pyruvate/2-oxoglutarate dehydrogenase complex dihydrolipoamide dehydrogenase (E3) component